MEISTHVVLSLIFLSHLTMLTSSMPEKFQHFIFLSMMWLVYKTHYRDEIWKSSLRFVSRNGKDIWNDTGKNGEFILVC